ncbi:DUF5659 domain-containing protein [Cytobacillus sp. FSL K6-0129]|uniref:DUF5659 domain-containing protein n=1 Tax=Cytobacillus sp. FSL K6-0129 TaxID=2921421 RepID=UPI0030F4E977
MKHKCILSIRVAKYLLLNGFRIVDIEPSRKFNGQVVFIFEETPALIEELSKLHK